MYDVAIIGGGPAGLAAALVLGRSRKRVLLLDGGVPRNVRAQYIGGFITQDRIIPSAFRATAHDDLRAYPTVELRLNTIVSRIDRGAPLVVHAGGVEERARRVLFCTGLIDEPLPLDGSRALWGRSLFQCPYCHAYEVRDRKLAFLSPTGEDCDWALLLRSWSSDVMVFTNAAYPLSAETRATLERARMPVEEHRIVGLSHDTQLRGVLLEDGTEVPLDALFFRPVQKQAPVVAGLGLALTEDGYVRVDESYRTSMAHVYAAGDLITHYHGALAAADAGSKAAHCINHELTVELVLAGQM